MERQVIRDFNSKIIAYIETQPNGNKTLTDFYSKILGRYDAQRNVTTDFYGKIIAQGDALTMLIEK